MNNEKPIHIDLFSGIGGFALAAEKVWPGIEHVFCEIDPFCQEVLKKHWPEAYIYSEIRLLTADADGERRERGEVPVQPRQSRKPSHDIGRPYLLTGGFPCQPFSQAGVRKGRVDDRYLWPEMLRVIREFRPEWVIAENVAGLLSIENGMVFEQVCADLEGEGYEVWPFVIPACAVGAPHKRDRIWFVAHTDKRGSGGNGPVERGRTARTVSDSSGKDGNHEPSGGEEDKSGDDTYTFSAGLEGGKRAERDTGDLSWGENWIEVAARFCGVDDGLPRKLDRNPRLKTLGNAIVPQVAEKIMIGIRETDI